LKNWIEICRFVLRFSLKKKITQCLSVLKACAKIDNSLGFDKYIFGFLLFYLKYLKMTIAEAQQRIDKWIHEYGVRYFDPLTNTALLMEEVGEVARIMARRYGEQSEKPSDQNKDLGDELADVLFVVLCLANQTGIDLTAAIEKNLDKKTKRDGQRHLDNEKLKD
jgi:NTP pyrophosphatase (non-canonical NTP hydrolase)